MFEFYLEHFDLISFFAIACFILFLRIVILQDLSFPIFGILLGGLQV